MSQVTVEIGGRAFDVVCQEGEEEFLQAAAAMLNEEAAKIDTGGQRIPESRMLLMAGLLLADRTAAVEDKIEQMDKSGKAGQEQSAEYEAKLRQADVQVATLQARVAEVEAKMASTDAETADDLKAVTAERDAALESFEKAVGKIEALTKAS